MSYRKLFYLSNFEDKSEHEFAKDLTIILILFLIITVNNRYRWYKYGSQIKGDAEIATNKNTGELVISKKCVRTKLNFGIYYCIAENKYGSTMSPFVKISQPGNQSINNCMLIYVSVSEKKHGTWQI